MYQNRNLCFEVEDFTKKGKSYENLHKFVDLLLDQEQVIKIWSDGVYISVEYDYDDPDIAEKMKLEIEGIFLWAFEGLQRLAANNFRFTESPRTLNNREYVKRDANNAIDFMESTGYIRLKADMSVTSKELYAIYGIWCDENGLTPIRQRSFSDFLMRNLKTYNLEHTNTVTNATGRRVWGYLGIEPLISPRISENWGKSLCTYVPES